MILYGIDNIRDLFGHKVWYCFCLSDAIQSPLCHAIASDCSLMRLQVSLNLIRKNPLCRLGL